MLHLPEVKALRKAKYASSSPSAGFSLIEVVGSVAIVAFALLSMTALLPLGLDMFRGSNELYFASQARQQVLNNLQQTGIASLLQTKNPYQQVDYFDGAGDFLGTNIPAGTPPVYQVIVTVSTTPGASAQGTAISVPGSPLVSTLQNAALVTTQFSRCSAGGGATPPTASGGSVFLTATDYLFYKVPQP